MITLLGYKVDDSGREQYNKGIDQTKQKQQSMTASFLKANIIMNAASKGIGAAFGFIKDSVFGATAETERYRVALGTMMGDQEKANKIIRDLDYGEGLFEGVRLSDFYGTANAIGGLQNMVTFGMEAEKAGDVLARLGDIAQGDSEAFVSMSNAMGQVFARGKADSTKLKQFASQGFDVVGEVAKLTGKSRAEIEKTGVSYEQTEAALRSLTNEGGKYHGMLAKQMDTLGGLQKQFASLKAAAAEAIGFGINDELKDMLKYILEIARAGQDAFVGKFVRVLREVIHWIFQVIIMFEVLGYRLEDMVAADTLKNFFEDLKNLAGKVLTGIMRLVVTAGRVFMTAFQTAYAFIGPMLPALGDLIQKVFAFAEAGVLGLIPIIQMLKPPLAVIGTVLGVIITGLGGMIDFLTPLAPIIVGIIAIIKIWTIVQWLLNAAMYANPIMLIVIAVIAAVALIVGLVMTVIKNWQKIADFFKWLGGVIADAFLFVFRKIGDFFKKLWSGIKSLFSRIVEFVKKNALNIANVLLAILFFPAAIIMAVVRLIIKHWDKIKETFVKVFSAIGKFAGKVWDGIKNGAAKAWEGIKKGASKLKEISINNFNKMKEGAAKAFNATKEVATKAWDKIKENGLKSWGAFENRFPELAGKIKNIFNKITETIKSVFDNIKNFFSGLWEALKEGPASAIDYIKNAFLGLFDKIQEKFFGFIQKIKDGWESVKGFFSGIGEGVANFFTGGNGGGGLQPAYATAGASTVGPTSNYAYASTGGSYSTVQANTQIKVNVPAGTSQEQSEAIARQINTQFDAKLAGEIDSTRANIPSPEVRRK